MKIKEIKIVNQDQSTEVADIGAEAVNVDYNDTTVKDELDKLNVTDNSLINKQTNQGNILTNLQSQVSSLASGGPAGVYATVAALTSADPDHSKIYLVSENGHWYYYNDGWQDGGIYQSSVNPIDVTIQPKNSNYLKNVWKKGYYINNLGEITPYSNYPENIGYCEINIEENYDNIITNAITGANGYIAFYDEEDNVLSCNNYNNKDTKTISIPITAIYVRISNVFVDSNPNRCEANPIIKINNGLFTFELNTYNDISDILNNMSNNENYLKKDWIKGYYINDNGVITQYVSENAGYLELNKKVNWKQIITNAVSGIAGRIGFYDSSNNIIELLRYNEIGLKKFIIPENTEIIRITNIFAGTNIKEENPYMIINNGLFTFEINTTNAISELNEKMPNLNTDYIIDENELSYPLEWIPNAYVNTDGEIVSRVGRDAQYCELTLLPTYKKLIINFVTGVAGAYAFYDNAGNCLTAVQKNNTDIISINIPNNATLFRSTNIFDASIKQTNPQLYIKDKFFTQQLKYDTYTDKFEKNIKQFLKGKKLSILGDSISTYSGKIPSGANSQYPFADVQSFDQHWVGQLLNRTGLVLEQLNSYGGSRVSNTGSIKPFVNSDRINGLGNPDIIIVFGGTNDIYQNATDVGTIPDIYDTSVDSYNLSHFKSAYLYLLTKIKERYPNAIVYCCSILDYTRDVTSFYFKNSHGLSKQIINETIKECSDIANCRFIDLFKCGINYFNYANYSTDRLHPNYAGMTLIADYIYKNL